MGLVSVGRRVLRVRVPWYTPVDRDYWLQYENRPMVIASSIVTPGGGQLVSNPGATGSRSSEIADQSVSTVSDISKLTGDRAAQYAGRTVHTQVLVERVTSARGFWTKSGVFVALDPDIREPNVSAGDQVTVSGRVAKAPTDKSKIDSRAWDFNDQDVSALMHDQVFIRAHALTHQPQS